MQAAKFELTLESGEKITCSKAGAGPRIAYIPGGPGSFYFKGLQHLGDQFTFITSDDMWTYRKPYGQFFTQKGIQSLTAEAIKKRDHLTVNALKKLLNTDEIHGFGFSGPGAFLLEQALVYPEDYRSLICTGVGVTPLDPTFAATNAIFYQNASPERIKSFDKSQQEYKEFQSSLVGDPRSIKPNLLQQFDFKADGKEAKKFKEKPHKVFVAEAISMQDKLLYDPKNKGLILDHWKHNPFNEHVDKRFQEHFFINIFPKLNPLDTITKLTKRGTAVLLVYGETDFVTPLTDDIVKQLEKLPNLQLILLKECGHIAYMEKPLAYKNAVMNYISSDSEAFMLKSLKQDDSVTMIRSKL